MKNISYIILLFIAGACFSSCTKVIDANLGSSPDLFIIEGRVADSALPWVKISRVTDVEKDNDFPPVTTATVTITDDENRQYILVATPEGIYKTANTIGVPGKTYTLKVEIDGQVFSATSTMPQKIYIDSLGIRTYQFGEGASFATVSYTDPLGTGNYYRAVLTHNDTLRTDIFVDDDRFSDGNSRESVLFSSNYTLEIGDSFSVEMQCIDKNVYNYFNVLQEVDGSSSLASPGNPQGNISGGAGAIGYFSAYTSVTMGKRVKEL